MKSIRQSCLLMVGSLALASMAHAGIGQGNITEISVRENGDIAFSTTENQAMAQCSTNNWILPSSAQPNVLYGAVLVAALQDAQVSVSGTGACSNDGYGEVVGGFSFNNNASLLDTNSLDALIAKLTLEKDRTYPDISESEVDCLLNEVESQLTSSGLFNKIVVPRTHTGDVTFSMKIGKNKDFVIHYEHNEENLDVNISIVKSAVSDDKVWKIVDDGMKACVPGAGY